MERLNHFKLTVFLTVFLLAGGTVGYMIIEGWSLLDALYMTVITLATVGYSEVHSISDTGRLFTMLLIFMGVGFFMYVAGNVIQFLVEGRLRFILGRRKLDKEINKLNNHFIICGYGRIGKVLCSYLTQKNLDVIIIEQDKDRTYTMEEDRIPYLVGNATQEEILIQAGIDRAKGLLTALRTDADNVFLVLIAKRLNPDIFIVARASQEETKKTLYAAGADKVVSPYDLGARRMAHAVLRPTVIHFLEMAFTDESADILIEEIPVSSSSKLVDVSLMDSGIRKDLNVIVLTIKKADGSMLFNPTANARIQAGDIVVATGKNSDLKKLEKLLRLP